MEKRHETEVVSVAETHENQKVTPHRTAFGKMVEVRFLPLLIFSVGVVVQILVFIISVVITLNSIVLTAASSVNGAATFLYILWMAIPLLAIPAIILAVIQIRSKKRIALPIVGLILNILWIIVFAFTLYVIFVIGPSV